MEFLGLDFKVLTMILFFFFNPNLRFNLGPICKLEEEQKIPDDVCGTVITTDLKKCIKTSILCLFFIERRYMW